MRLPRVLTTLAAGLGLLFGAVTAPPAHADDGAAAPAQWRSYWVDAFNPGISTPAQVAALVKDALDVNGLAVERAELVQALTQGEDAPFKDEAAVPGMPWKAAPRDGHVTGRLALRGGGPLDQVPVTLAPLTGGGEKTVRLSDGSGWFGFAHVEPGVYVLTLSLPEGVIGAPATVVKVRKGGIAKAVFPLFLTVP
ncbi:hypothetical protein [Streptomyces hirsutus]|uniref:hypothetical protein n=1 Tax=Streptomyces hirsutus TaxID=35620 RepID=UPI0036A8EB2B